MQFLRSPFCRDVPLRQSLLRPQEDEGHSNEHLCEAFERNLADVEY